MLGFAVKQHIPVKYLHLMFGDKRKKKKNKLLYNFKAFRAVCFSSLSKHPQHFQPGGAQCQQYSGMEDEKMKTEMRQWKFYKSSESS